MKRLFIVGCPRSGTTIIQRELCRRIGFWTLPETGFFVRSSFDRNGRFLVSQPSGARALFRLWHAIYGLPTPKQRARSRLARHAEILREIASKHGIIATVKAEFSLRAAAIILAYELDSHAKNGGFTGWIEKTPRHFASLQLIRDYVPGSRFIFVLRNGMDTAASIRDRAVRYPNYFGSEAAIPAIASLVNATIQCAANEIGRTDVVMISYENFVADPERSLGDACRKLGLTNDPDHADNLEGSSRLAFIPDMEPWKRGASGEVAVTEAKAERVFSRKEISILKQLLYTDLEAEVIKACVNK